MKLYVCFFRESDPAGQHEKAHRLLKYVLKREYGLEDYTLSKNSHGKPGLVSHPHIRFNLSHCREMAVCGVGATALGVDGEKLRLLRRGVVRRSCAPSEVQELEQSSEPDLCFTRLWTLKESFIKAVGLGLSYPMRKAVFSLAGENVETNIIGARFWQYVIEGQYVISACAAEPETQCEVLFLTEGTI
ncbi:MAG: 4'-phosphopantetheinyl transferase superfamily protein [Ruminococcus sp.]|nr:4'-phosphopantetheinyl transferase superfamily protein [Ruminococcus sp.]